MKILCSILILIFAFTVGKTQTKEYKNHYSNGVLKESGFRLANGNYTGKWQDFYEDGQLKQVRFYDNHALVGEEKEYYETGELKTFKVHKDGKVVIDKSFYKNGKEIIEVKRALSAIVKNSPDDRYFVKLSIPAERQTIQLFDFPLQVEGYYFSGIKFKTPTEGFLYWNFQSKKNNQIGDFYLVSTDVKEDDLQTVYFQNMSFSLSEDRSKLSDWIIQKTKVKLKANTNYILWFRTKETTIPVVESLTVELKFLPNNTETVGTVFKNSFSKVLRDL